MRLIKENKTSPEEMAIVNIQLGQVVADAANWLGQTEGFDVRKEVDLIAGQGQTVSSRSWLLLAIRLHCSEALSQIWHLLPDLRRRSDACPS
jgi:hypothetical protein